MSAAAQLVRDKVGGQYRPDDPGEPGYAQKRKRQGVTPEEAFLLMLLARGHRTVWEIGTGLGISTRALAASAKLVMTSDVDPWVREAIVPDLVNEFPNVSFLGEKRTLALPPSLVFIDGCHEADDVAQDIRDAIRAVTLPGMIVLHDGRIPTVQEGVKRSGADLRLAYPIATECGLIVLGVSQKS